MSKETEKHFNRPVSARKKCTPKTRRDFSSSNSAGRSLTQENGIDFISSSTARNFASNTGIDFSALSSAGRNFTQETGVDFGSSNTAINFAPKTGTDFTSSDSAGQETGIDFSPSSRSLAPFTANPGYFNNSISQQMMQHLQQQQQGDQTSLPSPQLHRQMPYPLFSSPVPFLSFGPMSLPGIDHQTMAKVYSSVSCDKTHASRGLKNATPEDQKDNRYFERRRRNNESAKKSRDARRTREEALAKNATELQIKLDALHSQITKYQWENEQLRQLWIIKCQKGVNKPPYATDSASGLKQNSGQNTSPNSTGQGKANCV